ncbi:MAG: hypothetical protein ACJ0DF_08285 [Paracoccaceae bacterium]
MMCLILLPTDAFETYSKRDLELLTLQRLVTVLTTGTTYRFRGQPSTAPGTGTRI